MRSPCFVNVNVRGKDNQVGDETTADRAYLVRTISKWPSVNCNGPS